MIARIAVAGVLSCVLAYLLGSINFAIVVTRVLYHKDIRAFGSGNAGMTNVLRTFGKGAAALTLIGDIGKGVVAVYAAKLIFRLIADANPVYGAYVAAIFAVLGHLFPVYFKFKGGKGVAVAAGAILAIEPLVFAGLAVIFFTTFLISRIVSLSSIFCAVGFPVLTCLYSVFVVNDRLPWLCTLLSAFLGALVIYMHRENISRLKAGTEYKFGSKKNKQDKKEETE